MKIFAVIWVILISVQGMSQPTMNEWYDFGRTQSVYSNIISTDSCYYSIGQAASNVVPNCWDMVFSKTDLNGNVEFTHFLHYDTVSINSFYSNLIPTYDGNFITAIDYDQYFMIIKYSPLGDTLFTKVIKDIYQIEADICGYPTAILENPEDSSYSLLLESYDELTWEGFITYVNLSKTGELNNYVKYNINQTGYFYIYPRDLIKEPDGYLISCDIIKDVSGKIDDRERVRLIKTDNGGNELWRWTDMVHANDVFPFGLTKTPDDGYLYGGITGWYISAYNNHRYLGHIVKLDSNLNQDWEIKMGDSTGLDYIRFSEILELENNRYVATGYCTKDTMTIGWLVNFDISGQVHWDSYFSYVPGATATYDPWHELYDVERTPDKGFVMVGNAWDVDATASGNPGSFAWLVKTDSVGCLVPGCQDFFSVEENKAPQIQLRIYPNPAADILNIYFYHSTFSGNETIQVYDLQGKLMREWLVHTNDITFMYDVSMLPAGAYVLKVIEGGVEKAAQKFVVE